MMRTALAFLLALVLALPAAAQQQQQQQQQQKVIKDAAEYKAYMAAYDQKDAGKRAAAMEAFAQKYPESVVRLDALEQALAGWQQAGNRDKLGTASDELLKADPDNLRALAIHVHLLRGKAAADDAATLGELKSSAERGLGLLAKWRKPEGLGDADFARLRTQVGGILHGAAGFVALQAKDYAAARPHYVEALKSDAGDLQNTYQLALACLEAQPIEPDGFWYAGRAIALARDQAQDSIKKYAAAKYRRYHGSEEGWADLLAKAAKQPSKPADFSVKPAP